MHVYQDSSNVMGQLMYDLGNIYQLSGKAPGSTIAFWMLFIPMGFQDNPSVKFGAKLFLGNFGEKILTTFGSFAFKIGSKWILSASWMENALHQLEFLMEKLSRVNMLREDAKFIEASLRWIVDLSKLSHFLGRERIRIGLNCSLKELPPDVKQQAKEKLEQLIGTIEDHWLWSSRVGGLKDSKILLENILTYLQ